MEKIPSRFQKAELEFAGNCFHRFFHCIYKSLHSLYLVLSIVSYLRDDLKYLEGYAQVICKHHAILQASLMSQQVKNLPASAGDKRYEFDPWAGKIPWRRKWQPTPESCLENSMDRGTWQATIHGAAESDTTKHTHAHLTWASTDSGTGGRSWI